MIAENQKFIGVVDGKDGKPFYFPEAMTDQAVDWLHGVRTSVASAIRWSYGHRGGSLTPAACVPSSPT